ncbi:DNA-binding protein WhiA [Leucobacter sp. UCMA 4100]|uniref:DNA-binding protein WhiA n=1 Tax=Leucobacter sp. UCMA 4100 TaxID=2810534 RepID=UPI0022EA1D13|nr:DNA-binding protein WhiA [Leucobacter sp. UCMA 4100]MDA3148281.1 DNA-binding protein WhiA [Leucobacter sp. UCMA 4100]
MASTADIKNELVTVRPQATRERIAEVTTILRFAGGLHVISGRIALEAELHTAHIVQRVRRDLHEIYGVRAEAKQMRPSSNRGSAPEFLVRVLNGETLARQLGLLDAQRRQIRGLPNNVTTGRREELAAAWRGAFLARGALITHGRSMSLEVVAPGNEAAMALVGAAGRLGIAAKAREIRSQVKVMIKDEEAIGEMLLLMGAPKALEEWNNVRTQRENRANANRLVNFDDANLRRSAQASVHACARVQRALEILGDEVPEHLKYAGELRLAHREASLNELGSKADPVLTKDAVAGRIRRLLAMADKEAEDRGIPGTDITLPEDTL